MKIDILCGEGSQDGVHLSDIYGENGRIGVGGAELALLTLCEAWTKDGNEVTLYNNPKRQDGVFEQRAVNTFDKYANRDVLISFRQPTQKVMDAKGKKIFWSCDQYTIGDFKHFAKFCDTVVTISEFHSNYFAERYGIADSVAIDLPVRTWEYESRREKVADRIIFTSVPDRGLWQVAETFPKIRKEIPNASLVITSDYRLWGIGTPNNNQFVQKFMRMDGVQFIGAVPRSRLIEEQLKAQIHLYPFSKQTTEELFCIAVAESQVAGVLPITSTDGALETTNMGVQIEGAFNPVVFADKTIEYLKRPDLQEIQCILQESALKRFSIKNIIKQWDEKVFNAG